MDAPLGKPDDVQVRVSEERPEPFLALALKYGHIPYVSGTGTSVSHPFTPRPKNF